MTIWQLDCYRRPLQDAAGQTLWALLICDAQTPFRYRALSPQAAVSPAWLLQQIQLAIAAAARPDAIAVFRPQTLNLLEPIAADLGIPIQLDRHPTVLHQQLRADRRDDVHKSSYTGEEIDPLHVDQPAPNPLPEHLVGDRWQFLAIAAGDFAAAFADEPMPYLNLPPERMPLAGGIASSALIPGVVIYGGRRSRPLAMWLQAQQPMGLTYIAGAPDGLILAAGLCDRWVLATVDDPEIRAAAQLFTNRQAASKGLHFLLIQPDDSGMTSTGLWLLRSPGLSGVGAAIATSG